jgi:poly(A) polymerase
VTRVAEALERSARGGLARAALAPRSPWVVGGTVRDALLGRPLDELDLVVAEDPRGAAMELARAGDGHAFELSEKFGAWRVVAPDGSWQADVTPLRGDSIEADLALRDFTVNAIATPLAGGDLTDPHGGVADLDARILRAVGDAAFRDDPLRTMRMARLASDLGFEVEERTLVLVRAAAHELRRVSPERSFYELRKLVTSPDPLTGLHLMEKTDVLGALLPELAGLRGVEQNPYHHLDVWGHTLEVLARLLELEQDLEQVLGDHAGAVRRELDRPLADELTRGQALRLGALLHDVGKPATRAVSPDGRVLFWGHDQLGADMSREIARRLRASATTGEYVAQLALHHLRLGFLVHRQPLSRRDVYEYMRACEPVEVEVTLLTTADRLATRGERTRPEAIEGHLALARRLVGEALAWRAAPPRPPVTGEELMEAVGLEPGPEVGRLLEALREAAFAGEVSSKDQALELARASVRRGA